MNAPNELPKNRGLLKLAAASLFFLLAALPLNAQQTTGVPGSPSATTTIPGNQLPAPPQRFGGVIKETAKDSSPFWPATIVPPKGAPNVLLIMTDDQGYGVSGTFGGVIPTPAMDRVAAAGLRYTQFHSTALNEVANGLERVGFQIRSQGHPALANVYRQNRRPHRPESQNFSTSPQVKWG